MSARAGVDPLEERRPARRAGLLGLGAAAAMVAASGLSSSPASGDVARRGTEDRSLLSTLHREDAQQLAGAALRVLALVLLVGMVVFLLRAVRDRGGGHGGRLALAGAVGLLLLAVSSSVAFLELRSVAATFADGPLTDARATALLERARDGALLRGAQVAALLATLLVGIWVALISYEAGRVGLLTRFLCAFGMGAGAAIAAGFAEAGQALVLGWLVSVSLLALGWWPGGRPAGWTTGRAVPWGELEHGAVAGRGAL